MWKFAGKIICRFQPPPSRDHIKDKTWPKDKPLIRGGSVIISPMGEVLAGPLFPT